MLIVPVLLRTFVLLPVIIVQLAAVRLRPIAVVPVIMEQRVGRQLLLVMDLAALIKLHPFVLLVLALAMLLLVPMDIISRGVPAMLAAVINITVPIALNIPFLPDTTLPAELLRPEPASRNVRLVIIVLVGRRIIVRPAMNVAVMD